MTDPSVPPPSAVPDFVLKEQQRRRRKRRNFWLIMATVVLLPLFALVGIFCYNHYRAEADLAAAIAETDKLDPEWRLDQIEKKRLAIPNEENAANHIQTAISLMPKLWPLTDDLLDLDQPPRRQFDLLLLTIMRQHIERGLPAAAAAQKALPLKNGAFPIAWSPDYISTNGDHLQRVRALSMLLVHIAILQSNDGQHDDAMRTVLTQLALTRAIDEEPWMISLLVGVYIKSWAVITFERTLAQGVPSESALAEAQRQLTNSTKQKGFVAALCGERAGYHRFFAISDWHYSLAGESWLQVKGTETVSEWFASGGSFARDPAWLLRFYNEALRCAELPPHEMIAGLKNLQSTVDLAPPAVKLSVPSIVKIGQADVRTQALLRCAIAGIAAERFRLKTGHWPKNLDELVASKLLDEVLQDPFDAKPLRYRKTSNGVVIFSVGVEGNYAGDFMDVGREDAPTSAPRCEFRLWDEKDRRQPAWKKDEKSP